jgi:hypothetical protein
MTKYRLNPRRASLAWVYWLSGVVLVVLVGSAVYLALISGDKPVHTTAVAAEQPVNVSPDVTSKLLFVGDVFWGRSVQTKAERSSEKFDYLLSGIDPAFREQYDGWIGNFECPVTSRDIPYAQQVSSLKFNCRPEYLPSLAKFFTAASLANNHTDNNGGKQGQTETRQSLQKQGIQYFGSYDMNDTDDICEVVTVPAKAGGEATSIPIALCGYMYVVNVRPLDEQLAIMKRYAEVMPVVAMPHMGVEYRGVAEPEKESAYRRMIDAGADLVIGAHPHVIQNSKSYKGKLIAYSLGNFLFDQQSLGRDTSIGLGVTVDLRIKGDQSAEYTRLGKDCKAYKDDCLDRLEASKKARPTLDVSYGFTCFDQASLPPKVGSDAVCVQAKAAASEPILAKLSPQW